MRSPALTRIWQLVLNLLSGAYASSLQNFEI
jgi:hypothetical protein